LKVMVSPARVLLPQKSVSVIVGQHG